MSAVRSSQSVLSPAIVAAARTYQVGAGDLKSKRCFEAKGRGGEGGIEKPWAVLAAGSPDRRTYFKLFTYFLLDVWLLRLKVWQ